MFQHILEVQWLNEWEHQALVLWGWLVMQFEHWYSYMTSESQEGHSFLTTYSQNLKQLPQWRYGRQLSRHFFLHALKVTLFVFSFDTLFCLSNPLEGSHERKISSSPSSHTFLIQLYTPLSSGALFSLSTPFDIWLWQLPPVWLKPKQHHSTCKIVDTKWTSLTMFEPSLCFWLNKGLKVAN